VCYLISVAVTHPGVDVKSHFYAYDLRAAESGNPTVHEALGTHGVYDITDHGCSCSLQAYTQGDDEATQRDKLRRRYAQKGWGDAKIERAISSSSRTGAASLPSARTRFLTALKALCESSTTVRVLAHDYSGRFDEERFRLGSPFRVSLSALVEQPFADDAVLTVHS
jgi:hypothetical protein